MIASLLKTRLTTTAGAAALAIAGLCGPILATPAAAMQSEEAAQEVDERWVWDLSDLYESPEAWNAAHDAVKADIAELAAYEGTLGDSADAMADAFEAIWAVSKDAVRLLVYATLKGDEDVRIAENEARRQRAQLLLADLSSATSWVDPELLDIDEARVERFLSREDRLQPYAFYIENVLRGAPHTLTAEAEAVLAGASSVTGGPDNIRSTFFNGELPWPEVELSTGETVTLNPQGYSFHRQAENRDDRKLVMDEFFGKIGEFEATLGSMLGSHLQGLQLYTKARDYDTSVQRSLFGDAMPPEVYETLIENVNASLPTLHRYFELRKRMLGIEDDLRYYDIYPPLVSLDKEFTIEESIVLTRRALAPLGDEYLAAYDMGVEGQWMHVYPSDGKRSGAYMFGSAYDVHPYVLLNHYDDYDSASTFAHEYGHAVHSVLANEVQPWPTAGYATFIAETSSIMNEMLLSDLVVKEAETPEERLFYLGQALEGMRGTYFRQAMFGEFELEINKMADAGEPVTGEAMTAIYLDLLKRYHGHEEGVLIIDDAYATEWAYIPHFYYDFYVYQYATSIAAASYLAEQIASGDEDVRDRFITLLKAGGSDNPFDLMKQAGLDLTEDTAYQALERRMSTIMDEMEEILAEMEE